jgi:hypothetical protein
MTNRRTLPGALAIMFLVVAACEPSQSQHPDLAGVQQLTLVMNSDIGTGGFSLDPAAAYGDGPSTGAFATIGQNVFGGKGRARISR